MITLLAAAPPVVMPMWVFLLLVVLLIGLNAFLMWCNHEQARTIRRQKRRLHLHVEGDPLAWTDAMSDRVIERMRVEGGDR